MRVMPIVYVSDVDRATAFYQALGLAPDEASRSGAWAQLRLGDAALGLHQARPLPVAANERVELCFATEEKLERLVDHLAAQGIHPARDITDEAFGRSLTVTDPDGLEIQINEHDSDLYT